MSNRVKESIFIGHRVTNPILFGVKEAGQLGARNELDLAYEIFTNTYIAERQNTLLRTIKKLAFYEIQKTDIEIIPLKPIDTVDLTSDIILANLTRAEIRELINQQTGLELAEEVTAPVAPVALCSHFADDSDISHLFDNIGVSEDDYEEIGAFDIHFDSDGSPMEFATTGQGIIQRVLKAILTNPLIQASGISSALELTFPELITSIGILKDSKLIEITGEAINLTPTGRKVAEVIDVPQTEVKYKYTLRSDAPALKTESRDFCKKMMSKRKLYSKAEIELLRNDMKSSSITDVTDVWLARGGWYRKPETETSIPYCRHIWKQVIVRKKGLPSNTESPRITPVSKNDRLGDKMPLVLDYEAEIKGNKVELAGVYDLNGNLIFKKEGNKNSVSFSFYEQFAMQGKVLTHNHPLETGFSVEDIEMAFYNKLSEIRAVTKKHTYSLAPITDLKAAEVKALINEFKKISKLTRVKLTDDYNIGKISKQDFKDNFVHEQILLLSKTKFGKYFKYSRK